MELKRHCVAIGRGEGLVARSGDVLMYVTDAGRARGLLHILHTTAHLQGPATAECLAALVHGPESGAVPAFGAVIPTAEGLQLILRGDVIADIESEVAPRRVSGGTRPLTHEAVGPRFDRITICTGTTTFVPCADTDLIAGVVPGSGFVLQPRVVRAPVRQAPPPAPATMRARPVSGALTADDGAVYPLDRPYIIGRNPMIDPAAHSAAGSPISVPDDPQVSRVHAYVTVNGGLVMVRDARTVGGTYIAAPGDQVWTPVGEQPVELKPGCYLRVGQKILTYQVVAPRPQPSQ
ncbi:MAG: FHA domain-containing protein [Mycobacterium sp.]|nr:FHA domain-containing protein [Mycobacterium sp.]